MDADDLLPDPLAQFGRWLDEARLGGVEMPEAVTLATADAEGRPSARTVLLKGVDADGFRFFTNTESRKARELAANPNAALAFHWPLEFCERGQPGVRPRSIGVRSNASGQQVANLSEQFLILRRLG